MENTLNGNQIGETNKKPDSKIIWINSGFSEVGWCKLNNVNYKSFMSALSKLRKKDLI